MRTISNIHNIRTKLDDACLCGIHSQAAMPLCWWSSGIAYGVSNGRIRQTADNFTNIHTYIHRPNKIKIKLNGWLIKRGSVPERFPMLRLRNFDGFWLFHVGLIDCESFPPRRQWTGSGFWKKSRHVQRLKPTVPASDSARESTTTTPLTCIYMPSSDCWFVETVQSKK